MGRKSGPVAFGGVMAALAVAVMSLVGLIPVMTYVCPLLCLILLAVVRERCGNSIAWAWYGAVSILSLLLAPDKEAAVLLVFLGYYPMVKPWLDRLPAVLAWVCKLLLLSLSVGAAYALLIWVLGLEQIAADFRGAGILMAAVLGVLGLLCLIGTDIVLTRFSGRFRRG